MLGTGRPFVVEFINPRRVNFTKEQMKAAQVYTCISLLPVINLRKFLYQSMFQFYKVTSSRCGKFLRHTFLQILRKTVNYVLFKECGHSVKILGTNLELVCVI